MDLLDQVTRSQQQTGNKPVVVHCRCAPPPTHTPLLTLLPPSPSPLSYPSIPPLSPIPPLPYSAGVGRTGTFCALSIAVERAKLEQVVNIFDIVKHLRTQRAHMVQTLVSNSY